MQIVRKLLLPTWSLALLCLVGGGLYWHTQDVPMYLDDISSISDNPAIHDPRNWAAIAGFSPGRFVGYLSFAVNYGLHGTEVAGYHLVNTVIHIGVAVVLYLLVLALGETPTARRQGLAWPLPALALFASALFLVHPLHTQAVTYIVQRLASLTALFYLLCLYGFLRARLAGPQPRLPWLLLCVAAALLALLTKQNALTLPAALLLMEYLFFAASGQQRRRLVLLTCAAAGLALLSLAALHLSAWLTLGELDAMTRETARVSRADYFASQLLILWRYLGLFFWPHPLVLDYGLLPEWRLSDWPVLVAAAGHGAVIALALVLRRVQPLVAFGLLFYYLAHSVESGVIPIKDLMFEHRTYLPDVGLSIAIAALLARLSPRLTAPVLLAALLALSIVTWQRNELWRDQIAFYNSAIAHAPKQPRNWIYLSKVYHKAGENAQALDFLTRELSANEQRNGRLVTDSATLVYWVKLLRLNGNADKAEQVEAYLARSSASPVERQRLILHRGNAHLEAGEYEQAAAAYREVLALNPQQSSAAVNLGVVALLRENYAEAIAMFERYPDHPVSVANLERARAALQGNYRFEGLEEKVIEKSR